MSRLSASGPRRSSLRRRLRPRENAATLLRGRQRAPEPPVARPGFLRRLWRSFPAPRTAAAGLVLALAALAALALGVPEEAEAQTVTTFISNVGQSTTTASDEARATAFTTGGNTAGYGLTSVEVNVSALHTSGVTPLVEIFQNSAGAPGTLHATLLNPATVTAGTTNTFNAQPNTMLSPNTVYWLVVSNSDDDAGQGFYVRTAANNTADVGAAMGWSIGNALRKLDIRNASWISSSVRIFFAVKGTATNTAAMGAPTITGTAQVGETLTAVTTGITDADGLTSPTYTYQWIRVDGTEADIAGENSSTYTLVDADGGHTETLTSAAYPSSGTVTAAGTTNTAPTVLLSVTVTSTPRKTTDTYGAREHIEFSMTFDKPVTVTGAPTFAFDLGGATTATWYAGSGTATLRFSHAVTGGSSGDRDTNGISWAENAIALNGGTIAGRDNAVAAVLTHVAQSNLGGAQGRRPDDGRHARHGHRGGDLDADVAGGHLRFRRDDRDHGHRQRGGGGGGRSGVRVLADRYGRFRQ